jgi:hypothetical protein
MAAGLSTPLQYNYELIDSKQSGIPALWMGHYASCWSENLCSNKRVERSCSFSDNLYHPMRPYADLYNVLVNGLTCCMLVCVCLHGRNSVSMPIQKTQATKRHIL